MKRKIKSVLAVLLLVVVFGITGCGASNRNPDYSVTTKDNYMKCVEEGTDYAIYVDDNDIMYYYMRIGGGDSSKGAMTVMLNSDGSPRVWKDK